MLFVNINVPNNRLRKKLESQKNMIKAYNILANRIMQRINLLQVVDNLLEIPTDDPERCHLLEGKYKDCFAISINAKWRIIIKPRGYETPYDKSKIKEIDIIEIIDYH